MRNKSYLRTALFFSAVIAAQTTYGLGRNPCGWYVELEPFHVKATDSLLSNSIFATKIADPMILGDFRKEYHINMGNDWGGHVVAGYNFPCCADVYGLSLEYTFLHNHHSTSILNDSRNSAGLPVITSAEFINITDEASARFSFAKSSLSQQYDTVDLLAAKNLFFCNSDVRFYAGIRYLHLGEDLHDYFEFRGLIGSVFVQNLYHVNFSNELNSIGPHVGATMFYSLSHGFGLTGQLAFSWLYGESRSEFHNSYDLSPGGTPLMGPTSLTSSNNLEDTAHVIPAISGKIGFGYRTVFCDCSSLLVEVGYRGDKYFKGLNDVAYQQLLAGDDVNSTGNYQDFSLSGPYFSLTYHI